MCGRYNLHTNMRKIAEAFGLADLPDIRPRYNVAPTQQILTFMLRNGRREAQLRHWGLIPSWATDPSIGNKMINARADGIDKKPSFRSAFKKSRCLIPADGFYEWAKVGKTKQPYLFRMKSGEPFAFAGLAEHWRRGELVIDSATIITGEPTSLTGDVHDRMPVILDSSDYDTWLSPETPPPEALELLRPYSADAMECFPVSTLVNSPKNEKPECIVPLNG
jgi:putative SOS response-associated peptidase YedK